MTEYKRQFYFNNSYLSDTFTLIESEFFNTQKGVRALLIIQMLNLYVIMFNLLTGTGKKRQK